MSKVIVLGANSFGGSSAIKRLVNDGFDVVGINRSAHTQHELLVHSECLNAKNYNFFRLNINEDYDELISIISREQPEFVVDFAGQGMVAQSWDNPEQWYKTNLLTKSKLHKWLLSCSSLKKYVRISTPEVYGNCDNPLKESDCLNPSTPYAISHAAVDLNLIAYSKEYGLPAVIGRFANFYGARQQPYRIIPRASLAALGCRKLILDGGGVSMRSFIHGDDVADAVVRMLETNSCEIFHFATDELVSIKSLVYKIAEISGVDFADFVEIGPERRGKDMNYTLDWSKSKNTLGWHPSISLLNGLQSTFDWAKANIEILKTLPQEYNHRR